MALSFSIGLRNSRRPKSLHTEAKQSAIVLMCSKLSRSNEQHFLAWKMFYPIFKQTTSPRNSFILFTLALNILMPVECKNLPSEVRTANDVAMKDPLVALPSESQQMNIESARFQPEQNSRYHASLSALSRQGEYEVSHDVSQQQQHREAPLAQQDQSNNANNHEGYYLVKPDGTVIQHVPEKALEVPQQQPASEEPKREYPGDILYVIPNGDSARPLNELPQGRTQNRSSDDYSHIAGAISRSSGLPATILTEIPIRDMPIDVLDKLRKDYGVRVVASREHPGANLVINCDEYSNQDNSICPRQPTQTASQVQHNQQLQPFNQEQPNQPIQGPQLPIQQQQHQQPESYQHTTLERYSSYPVTSVDENASDGQQPSEQARTPGAGLTDTSYASTDETVEPQQGYHDTRDVETGIAYQDQAATVQNSGSEKQTQPDEGYQSGFESQSERVNNSKEEHESDNLSRNTH